MTEKNKLTMRDKFKKANQAVGEKKHNLNSEIKKKSPEKTKREGSGKGGIRAAGEKIKKTIKIFQLKKKLDWIKDHVLENNKPPQPPQIGPEEKKLQILLKELEMLKRFNMLGFDSDAINLLLGLYYMVEMIHEEGKVANFLANGSIPEENKAASLELLLREWWGRVELLPSYKERTAIKYQHLGTKVVIEKLYSKRRFVEPLNNIINEINEYIKKRDIEGLTKAVKKSELFCEEIKKMARRPEKREYTGPIMIDELKEAEKKFIKDRIPPKKNNPGMRKFLAKKIKNFNRIKKIRGEASTRTFFRLYFDKYSLVAMVYPQENPEEISKIVRLGRIYRENNILVPELKEVIDNRIIVQEDLGDILVQKSFSKPGKEEKKIILHKTAGILRKLRDISSDHTDAILGHKRMKWEMDFFLQHFVSNFYPASTSVFLDHAHKTDPPGGGGKMSQTCCSIPPCNGMDTANLREKLHAMVEKIENITCFAHRDFHSRNMLHHKGELYLVDFQDSLVASPYYDLVSFAFDSYLDLKSLRQFLFKEFEKRVPPIDFEQLYLVALQRNIKALGTFGYQVFVKRNLTYKKYINRTIRHISNNPAVPGGIKKCLK